jgi:hypothetical protein
MMRVSRGILVLIMAGLTACASVPTLYRPAAAPGGIGYSEYRIEPGRFRVTFTGGRGAPAQQVADYALLRAADLTLAEGFDWFRVADRYTRATGGGGPQVTLGTGAGGFGRSGGVSIGIGTRFELGDGPALAQTLEVVMGKGALPRDADTYDARAIRRGLGAAHGEHA